MPVTCGVQAIRWATQQGVSTAELLTSSGKGEAKTATRLRATMDTSVKERMLRLAVVGDEQ